MVSPSIGPCAIPSSPSRTTPFHTSVRMSSVISRGSSDRNGRPLISVTSTRVTPVGHPGGDDRQHVDAAALGHQGQERLVFDLLEPARADMRRLASMPDRRPGRHQQLPVARVAAVDLHLEGATVRIGRRGQPGAARLERCVPQIRRLDVEVLERERDLIECEAAGRRAERQVHDRGGAQSDQRPGDHADRERDAEGDPRHRARHHDPTPDEPQRPAHVRRGHHHDRRRDGEAHREVDGGRLRRADGSDARRSGPSRRPARRASRSRTRAPRRAARANNRRFLPCVTNATSRSTAAQAISRLYVICQNQPTSPGSCVTKLCDGGVERGGAWGGDRQDRHADDAHEQQHDVGWASCQRGVARGGEDADVGLTQSGSVARSLGLGRPGLGRVPGRGRLVLFHGYSPIVRRDDTPGPSPTRKTLVPSQRACYIRSG